MTEPRPTTSGKRRPTARLALAATLTAAAIAGLPAAPSAADDNLTTHGNSDPPGGGG